MKNASNARPVGRPAKLQADKIRNVVPTSVALNQEQKAFLRTVGGSSFVRALIDQAMVNGGAYHAGK